MWNFLEWIRKCVGDQEKSHIASVSLFLTLGFSRGVIHFYVITLAITFNFSRISKTNLETQWSIYKGISSTTLLVFFPEQTIDRYIDLLFWVLRFPAHCTGVELFLNLPKIKSVTYYIQNIRLSSVSQ